MSAGRFALHIGESIQLLELKSRVERLPFLQVTA